MSILSVSVCKGKGSLRHNNRVFYADNIDKSRTKDNIVYKNESLEIAYKNCFEKAIEEYNTKQKRKDRKIDGVKGYIEQIKNSGNGEKLFYESIIQVGNMQDCGVGTDNWDKCKLILDKYMKNFEKRNPNLYVFNAVLHLDESTPHLHIDYIPIANGYTRGLQTRNSLDRALKQQGIEGKANKYENSTITWQNREKKNVATIMKEFNLKKTKDRGLKAKHKSIEYYKSVINDIKNEVKEMDKQIEYDEKIFNKEKVTVKKSDLIKLEKRAKLSIVHENAAKEIINKVNIEMQKSNKYIDDKKKDIDNEYSLLKNERIEIANSNKILEEQIEKLIENNKKDKENHNKEIQNLNDKIAKLEKDNSEKRYMEYSDGYNKGYYKAIDDLINNENAYNELNELKELNAFIDEKDNDLDAIDNMIIYNDFYIKSEEDIKNELEELKTTINKKSYNIENNNLFYRIKERLGNLLDRTLRILTDIQNLLLDKQNHEQNQVKSKSRYDDWER